MVVNFVTPTRISLVDLTSMGDSVKRDDDSKIGRFSSGLKYSMALILRMGADMKFSVYGGEEWRSDDELHGHDEAYTDEFFLSTYNKSDDASEKSIECILINVDRHYHGNNGHALTQREGHTESWTEETGFAKMMGFNWENWMALRELYSNMLDEGGYYSENVTEEPKYGTVIRLEFDDQNPFFEIWKNRHLYINEKPFLFDLGNGVEVLENKDRFLRIYKQNILVYSDESVPSLHAYNIKFGTIDERRILSNVWSVEDSIMYSILRTTNKEYLRTIISGKRFFINEREFLWSKTNYHTASDGVHDVCQEVYAENGDVNSYPWLTDAVKKRKDCKIGGKIITSISDSVYSYSTPVRIETSPETIFSTHVSVEDDSFASRIQEYFDFDLDVEVRVARLKGSKVVADKYEKCLIIDTDFDIQADFHCFIVEYVDLKNESNSDVVRCLGRYICDLIRKE